MHFLSGIKAATQSAKKKKKIAQYLTQLHGSFGMCGNKQPYNFRMAKEKKKKKKKDKLSFLRPLLSKFPLNAVLKESAAFFGGLFFPAPFLRRELNEKHGIFKIFFWKCSTRRTKSKGR